MKKIDANKHSGFQKTMNDVIQETVNYVKANPKDIITNNPSKLNRKDINALIDKLPTVNKAGAYVYVFIADGKEVYVGKSEGGYLENRLREHFIGASIGTSTKYDDIRKAKQVVVAIMEIIPEYLSNAIKNRLINKLGTKSGWSKRKP